MQEIAAIPGRKRLTIFAATTPDCPRPADGYTFDMDGPLFTTISRAAFWDILWTGCFSFEAGGFIRVKTWTQILEPVTHRAVRRVRLYRVRDGNVSRESAVHVRYTLNRKLWGLACLALDINGEGIIAECPGKAESVFTLRRDAADSFRSHHWRQPPPADRAGPPYLLDAMDRMM
jgi:hypothetical protein